MKIRKCAWGLILLAGVTAAFPSTAYAKNGLRLTSTNSVAADPDENGIANGKNYSALVVDAASGRVLYEENAGSIRYPASLTKMMTLYLAFDSLKKGKLSLNTNMPVSAKAAKQPPTNIHLRKTQHLTVQEAIESVVVRSANDSAVTLAEYLGGGSEWNFSLLMTKKARELGMRNTVFRNASGLPDNKQYTTAYDMARLAIALRRDFPEYYHFFQKQTFTRKGVTYPGHNHVMEKYAGVDGVKTGYIHASGYHVVTSIRRGGYNIVAVVMGGPTAGARDRQMMSLLDWTFAQLTDKQKNVAESRPVQSRGGLGNLLIPQAVADELPPS